MRNSVFIAGIVALGFGLANFLWYVPHSLYFFFRNQPFPFEHLDRVEIDDGGGFGVQISYLPFEAAMADPYWLVWSLSLYFGIIVLSILGIKSLRQKTIP